MSRLIEDYLEELFNEKNVSFVTRQKLWSFYNEKLSKAVDVGYSPDLEFYDEDLAKSLKENIAEFSAFKETSFKKEVESLLTDGKHLRSKSDFKQEALKVSDDYNYRWLETEQHHTIAVANMTSKLKDFERNVELYPNLKLVSVGDARVRKDHQVLNGTVRPFNDPFWKSHTPPLDWGCRCDLEQTDDEVTTVPGGFQTKIEFENNPLESGKVFGGSAYESNITVSEAKEAKKNAKKWLYKTNMSSDDKPIPVNEEKEKRKKQRAEINQFGKNNLLDLKISHKDLPYDIGFTTRQIKEFASQPYKHLDEKINILKNIENVIKTSKYIGKSDFKATDIYPFAHILEIKVLNEKSWLVIKESVDKQMIFYSISDSEKITENLIKK